VSALPSNARVAWLFGLPGAGKSTLAQLLAGRWRAMGRQVKLLDGDELRRGLCRDLGYTADARTENIRRAAEAARLFLDEGIWVVAAFITPTGAMRALARDVVGVARADFVFVRCPVDVCAARDPKGHYGAANRGERPMFTGVSDPFEEPQAGSCHCVDTSLAGVPQCVDAIASHLAARHPSQRGDISH
jgi:adenylylsulfate kinase